MSAATLVGAGLFGFDLFSGDSAFGTVGAIVLFLVGVVALYRAQKVAKSAEAWRDAATAQKATAEAEREAGAAWRSEVDAERARANRLQEDVNTQSRVVAEQLIELADLRARTDLQPLQEAAQARHAELVALLTEVVKSNNQIVAAVVKNGHVSEQ